MDCAVLDADRFPPGRDGVAALFDAVATVPESQLVLLSRSYSPAEQAERDTAWERVLDAAGFHHRAADIDEIREAAIQQVAVRHSAGEQRHAGSPFGLPTGIAMHDPLTQARIANAIVEAAGAILVADVVDGAVVELLAGPVLVLLDAIDEERAAAEQARLARYEPPDD
jgi:hypothetical protein